MRHTRNGLALVLLFVALAGMGACATGTPTTNVGKAVQIADVQQKLIETVRDEFMKAYHCAGHPAPPPACAGRPAVTDATYAKGKDAYQKWEKSQLALGAAIATAKAVGSVENEQKVSTVLAQMLNDVNTYLGVVSAFVDVPAIKKKIGG